MATALSSLDGTGNLPMPVNDDDYRPSADEPFMNSRQLEYFRRKLVGWKEAILREAQDTLAHLQSAS
jgi:DnaK suppressor protein